MLLPLVAKLHTYLNDMLKLSGWQDKQPERQTA
jgi:hypothetical protein